MPLFKKMLQFGRHVEQTDAIQVYYGRGSGGKAPSHRVIFAISGKNNHFNVIYITFQTCLRPLERTKLLILRIYLKFLNCLAFSASLFADQIQTTLNVCSQNSQRGGLFWESGGGAAESHWRSES